MFCSQVALVYGQMNEPPGARARVALTGLTVAEYFRDQEGQDVLLFIDNIFRFTQAGSEVRISNFRKLGGWGPSAPIHLAPAGGRVYWLLTVGGPSAPLQPVAVVPWPK